MSVQSWLDSEARRLLAEELQADATEATASDDPDGSDGASPYPIQRDSVWVSSNPASRRRSPNDPKGDR